MSDAPDDALALGSRPGLPPEMRYLVESFPRDRWTQADLDQTAAFWLQMHGSFRGHQGHMDGRSASGAPTATWRRCIAS